MNHTHQIRRGIESTRKKERNLLEAIDMVHKITVQLADMNGHSELLMTPAETVAIIQQNTSSWVFADNQMVQADQMNEENLSSVVNVRILPRLVGG